MTASSAEVQAFLRECVSSYEELEALLLLVRTPARAWSLAELARELGVSEDGMATAARRLATIDGLLATTQVAGVTRLRYAPSRESLARIMTELSRMYLEQRLSIVQLMSANALERLRGAAAQRLAGAFLTERPKK